MLLLQRQASTVVRHARTASAPAAACSSSAWQRPRRPGGGCWRALASSAAVPPEASDSITYTFAGVVYVSLTNDSNCALTMLAANGPGFEFPPGTGFAPLPQGFEPTAAETVAATLVACDTLDAAAGGTSTPREIVYAGLGEPLMRLRPLCEVVATLAAASDRVGGQRLNTNGLLGGGDDATTTAAEAAQMLADAGLDSACVQIQSSDATQHNELMGPNAGLSLADAAEFASQLLRAGVAVECSVIARPEVDVDLAQALALGLGATFKARPYFP
jgi:hypothetical protein